MKVKVLQMLMTIIMVILKRKFYCYKSIQQGIRVRVFVGEVPVAGNIVGALYHKLLHTV